MNWQLALLAALLALGSGASAAESIRTLAHRAIPAGSPNRVPGPIAQLLDLPADTPIHQVEIQKAQTTDGMDHLLKVIVELSTGTPRRPLGPTGLVLLAYRISEGTSDHRWFRATLEGTLERAIRIEGRVGEDGKGIKGSGTATKEDIESPNVKEAFQHELDLWLKKTHLKKEWRPADFVGGVLKKKDKRR